jgi:hypothetical protein
MVNSFMGIAATLLQDGIMGGSLLKKWLTQFCTG